MFQIGDTVRYGQAGVCTVQEIREMTISGTAQRYYVLLPLFKTGSLVYVPVENKDLVARIAPLTKAEAEAILAAIREQKAEWIRDFRRRSEFAKKALSSGDRSEAMLLIKSIYAHKRETMGTSARIHTTDDYFLKDAETLIYSEIAYAYNRSVEEVSVELRAILKEE